MKNAVRIAVLATLLVPVLSWALLKGETLDAGSASGPVAAPSTVEVKIDNFTFGPQSITIAAGTTVKWTNRDDIPHTVVSTEGAFKSRVLDTDESFAFTFSKPGNYPYFCSIHPHMTGSVVVQ